MARCLSSGLVTGFMVGAYNASVRRQTTQARAAMKLLPPAGLPPTRNILGGRQLSPRFGVGIVVGAKRNPFVERVIDRVHRPVAFPQSFQSRVKRMGSAFYV